MARPRIEFSPDVEAEIAARAARGETARTIAVALGEPKLQQTIHRRLNERRAPRRTCPHCGAPAAFAPKERAATANHDWLEALREQSRIKGAQ